eukprot:975896-Pyramimonas_sp.AAC.1
MTYGKPSVLSLPPRRRGLTTRIPPKALEHLSDEALRRLARMFEILKQHQRFPSDRLRSEMARLPKPDGGHRHI